MMRGIITFAYWIFRVMIVTRIFNYWIALIQKLSGNIQPLYHSYPTFGSPLILQNQTYLRLSSNSSNSCCLPFTHMKNIPTNPARTIETIVSIKLTPLWNSDTVFETSEAFCFNGRDEILVFIWISILVKG